MDPLAGDFAAAFGRPAELIAAAPGRVNLLGEHTDYNGGFVLPTAIPLRVRVALARRSDPRVEAVSPGFGRGAYALGQEASGRTWLDYVQGVTRALRHAGRSAGGFDLLIRSELPPGAGLSSSAALEVALLRGLRDLFGLRLADTELARLAQWGENNVVGAPVGILDPMACHLADERSALFLDTRSLVFDVLPLPADAELMIVDSGVRHAHAGGGYRERRAECERAARALGVAELRDVGLPDLPRVAALEPPLDRRARHVVTENARVLEALPALRAGDLKTLGRLFYASHESQRADFEVSVPEVDVLIERARARPEVFGARLTGGGFGGAVVGLVERGRAADVGRSLARDGARLLLPAEDV